MSASVSFRISRNTEDLATTLHTLSQRLVRLEQRLAAVEVQLSNQGKVDPEELLSLENVERLLGDCRDLLALDLTAALPAGAEAVEPALAGGGVPEVMTVASEAALVEADPSAFLATDSLGDGSHRDGSLGEGVPGDGALGDAAAAEAGEDRDQQDPDAGAGLDGVVEEDSAAWTDGGHPALDDQAA